MANATSTQSIGNYAPVNGLNLYYEIHGSGKPLVLLHGGFGAGGMFQQLIPALASTRQVIVADLQAHGRTADIDRPLTLEAMGDDIAALISLLGHEKADLFGYSLGGGVALQCAIRHPEVVRKLIVLSAPYRSDGWYPEIRAAMGKGDAKEMEGTIMHQFYLQIAPKPQDWPVLVAKMNELLGKRPYDLTEEVKALQVPTLVICGDADGFPPSHAVEMYGLLGGGKGDPGWDGSQRPHSQLAILPGVSHYESFMRADLLIPAVIPFLDPSDFSQIPGAPPQ
jgi:pimeloyl-ACP methyl ester carboxylesterase